ncbi:FAD-dependent oxidoreductase [Teichococcus aestuarii]|uniref:FAD-dependent oxidoreductase n=1 Tax=Teichococcus aestuarii TaxID=568898 RepID=UPI003620CCBB
MSACCSAKPGPQNRASEGRPAPNSLPVAIIGGGPVGLAAAAHLLEHGLQPVVFEAGLSVGTAPLDWGHVHAFSPWRYNVDRACRALLERHGWKAPDAEAFPTGRALVEDYRRLWPLCRKSPPPCA